MFDCFHLLDAVQQLIVLLLLLTASSHNSPFSSLAALYSSPSVRAVIGGTARYLKENMKQIVCGAVCYYSKSTHTAPASAESAQALIQRIPSIPASIPG